MLVLAAVATLIYGFINAFGAWMVIRRKAGVAFMFMLAASVLMVTFAAFIGSFPYTRVILATGLVLASLASFINAHVVLGNVIWRFHVLRAAIGLAIYLLAELALL